MKFCPYFFVRALIEEVHVAVVVDSVDAVAASVEAIEEEVRVEILQ